MRVIPEASLTMTDKDENGMHKVRDRYCKDDSQWCFTLDCNGRKGKSCDRFSMISMGVKFCADEKKR